MMSLDYNRSSADSNGKTAADFGGELYEACRDSDLGRMRELMREGADVNYRVTERGGIIGSVFSFLGFPADYTALMIASSFDNVDAIQVFI